MIAIIFTIIIVIAVTSRFYLKYGPMKSFATLMVTVFALILSFTFYEPPASFFISKGYIPQWVQGLCFFLIFAVVWGVLENVLDYIVGTNIDFGKPAKVITAVVCGLLSGLLISGSFVIVLGLLPSRSSIPYSRVGDSITSSSLANPSSAMIPADDLTLGLYKIIAQGALGSSSKRFDVVHADYLNQIHLNNYMAKDGVLNVAGKEAVSIDKLGAVKRELSSGESRTVIEVTLKGKSIKNGGARDKNNKLTFTLAQVRLLCGPKGESDLTGKDIKVIFPESYYIEGQPLQKDVKLSDVIGIDNKAMSNQMAKINMLFDIPEGLTPSILQFKSNNNVKVPKVLTEEEREKAVEEAKNKESETAPK